MSTCGDAKNLPLIEVLGAAFDEDDDAAPCQVCSV